LDDVSVVDKGVSYKSKEGAGQWTEYLASESFFAQNVE